MKTLLITLSIAVGIIFLISLYSSYLSINDLRSPFNLSDKDIAAFDPALQNVPGFEATEDKISKLIKENKETEKNVRLSILLINLFVTIATGACTLITSINTIKYQSVQKSAAISIAVITFVSSVFGWGQMQLSNSRDSASKKIEDLRKIRDELEAYTPQELPNVLTIINRKIDEL